MNPVVFHDYFRQLQQDPVMTPFSRIHLMAYDFHSNLSLVN